MRLMPTSFAVFLLAACPCCWAGDVIVIAHPGVTLSADEVREVFIGERQSAASVRLVPMDNGAGQADFLARVMKVDANKYASIWAKKGFREGINPPPLRGSDLEVISLVMRTPGAVGYVSKASAEVKIIAKF